MSTLIPFAGLATLPWKNGSGSTTEIAIDPPSATFDDFHWRISLATISENGPFSVFPGVERTLALVDGHGLTLLPTSPPTLLCGPTVLSPRILAPGLMCEPSHNASGPFTMAPSSTCELRPR